MSRINYMSNGVYVKQPEKESYTFDEILNSHNKTLKKSMVDFVEDIPRLVDIHQELKYRRDIENNEYVI